ncbi:RNA polymerase sigma factor (sigma-70 family) [Roseimicrobium gellanilyticum]|uniref:RNA polymerase sigma factor (Sigma-70 family) n=1 Tax=Roseimicrobium gellanilyticum TaxID=748857 RepID=A0A366HQT2_9BACT|nr:RNA polymerase sigma factor [Roseimicrobium gellanilyticum]RBP46015.1 RNA polymerase sigma factor (sigma-70 family) [Roseimicrobium gellanilyticum]
MSNDSPSPELPCPSEPGVFRDLVREHEAMVHATARRVTRNSALAEDVAQETFLALAHKPQGALGSVRAWLRSVAGRKALNAVRSESRRRRVEEAAVLALDSSEQPQSPDIEPLIRQTLEELPPHLKGPLVEHYLEGQSQQLMASRKAVSQSTISRQIAAGMGELKRRLRAKGILCGAGLTALWGGQSASAAPVPLGTLGHLVAGGAHSNTSVSTITSALLSMNIAKASLAVVVATAVIAVPVLLQDRKDTSDKPVVAKSPSKSPSAEGFLPASSINSKMTGKNASAEKHYRPEPVTEEVSLRIDALVARMKGMSEQEMMQDPEILELMENFMRLIESDMASGSRLEQALTDFMASKGVQKHDPERNGPPGFSMDMGLRAPDGPLARSWMEATLSNDPKRVHDWVLNRIEGATFEFSVDPSLDSSSEGVSVLKPQAAPKYDQEED